MHLNNRLAWVMLFATALLVFSCKRAKYTYRSPTGYQLTRPVLVELKTELDEISGLHFYPQDTSVFAIIDEKGSLYKIHLKKRIHTQKWKFSKKGDYEDLQLLDSTFYVMTSKGNITTYRYLGDDKTESEIYKLRLKGKNEFESFYYDSTRKLLVLLCKDCKVDDKKSLTAYGFNPANKTFSETPLYTMDIQSLAEKLGYTEMKFKPSAAAVNPVDKRLYIISSINKLLLIADLNGKIKEVYPIKPGLFKQPEGMAFTPNGDMLISNESADIGPANILVYKYKALK